jgi:TRAP-type C4-dicarboxylate transport system permease small subunit
MHVAAAPVLGTTRPTPGLLLALSDAVAATLLAADLLVVIGSVLARSLFGAPVEWADDVARGLMVGSSFFGAASAVARGENPGVEFFVAKLAPGQGGASTPSVRCSWP